MAAIVCLCVANSLLRLAVDGKLCLYFVPPGFTKEKGEYYVCIQ